MLVKGLIGLDDVFLVGEVERKKSRRWISSSSPSLFSKSSLLAIILNIETETGPCILLDLTSIKIVPKLIKLIILSSS